MKSARRWVSPLRRKTNFSHRCLCSPHKLNWNKFWVQFVWPMYQETVDVQNLDFLKIYSFILNVSVHIIDSTPSILKIISKHINIFPYILRFMFSSLKCTLLPTAKRIFRVYTKRRNRTFSPEIFVCLQYNWFSSFFFYSWIEFIWICNYTVWHLWLRVLLTSYQNMEDRKKLVKELLGPDPNWNRTFEDPCSRMLKYYIVRGGEETSWYLKYKTEILEWWKMVCGGLSVILNYTIM